MINEIDKLTTQVKETEKQLFMLTILPVPKPYALTDIKKLLDH